VGGGGTAAAAAPATTAAAAAVALYATISMTAITSSSCTTTTTVAAATTQQRLQTMQQQLHPITLMLEEQALQGLEALQQGCFTQQQHPGCTRRQASLHEQWSSNQRVQDGDQWGSGGVTATADAAGHYTISIIIIGGDTCLPSSLLLLLLCARILLLLLCTVDCTLCDDWHVNDSALLV
jgi:hypothetical protein